MEGRNEVKIDERTLHLNSFNSFLLLITVYFDSVFICVVKCTLVQALRVCTVRTAHRWIRGIALLFLDHGTRRG